jgi:hypothetical protein
MLSTIWRVFSLCLEISFLNQFSYFTMSTFKSYELVELSERTVEPLPRSKIKIGRWHTRKGLNLDSNDLEWQARHVHVKKWGYVWTTDQLYEPPPKGVFPAEQMCLSGGYHWNWGHQHSQYDRARIRTNILTFSRCSTFIWVGVKGL